MLIGQDRRLRGGEHEPDGSSGAFPARADAWPAARKLFVVVYSPGAAFRPGAPLREQGLGPHARYMGELQAQGRLFAGGGFGSEDGGMAIFVAADLAEAEAMLAADPAIVSGIFAAMLREWTPRFRTDAPLPN